MIYAMAEYEGDAETGYVKIGFVAGTTLSDAIKPLRQRLVQLQSGNRRKLRVVGAVPGHRDQEKALHVRFDAQRVRRPTRCEWFLVGGELSTWLAGIRLSEPIDAGKKIGRGSMGGAPPTKGSNRCSECLSVEHTRSRCPLYQPHKTQRTRLNRTAVSDALGLTGRRGCLVLSRSACAASLQGRSHLVRANGYGKAE
jgi:hypothetical protein